MSLGPRSPVSKAVGAALCLAASLAFAGLALRHYQATTLTASGDPVALRGALRLEPGNAAAWEMLARRQLMVHQDAASAVINLRRATALNPHSTSAWLLMAAAAQVNGDGALQNEAVLAALAADPTSPRVAWGAANLYLTRGETAAALREFRIVLAAGNDTPETLALCWRAFHDPDRLLRDLLAPRADLHLAFLQLLVQQNEPAAALKVWDHLLQLGQPFAPGDAIPFVQYLIQQREPERAWAAWRQLLAGNPALAAYLPAGDNLVVNGGFDEDLLGGFDWHLETTPGIRIEVDTTAFHGGRRALMVSLEDVRYTDPGISVPVLVKPNTHYAFSAYVRAEELETAQGLRFAVTDFYDQAPLLTTEPVVGTIPWHEVTGTFDTGPTTHLLRLRVAREPNAATLIRGRFWIDDVRVVPK